MLGEPGVPALLPQPLLAPRDIITLRAEHERLAEKQSLRARSRAFIRTSRACFFAAALVLFSWDDMDHDFDGTTASERPIRQILLVVAALSAGAATRFVAKHAERAVERETLEARERVVARASARVSEEPVNLSVATMPETPPLTPEVTPYYPDV